MPLLFIHPRRGLYQLTCCQDCGYKFGCDNCDCNLTTYRSGTNFLQLLCHQCQSNYNYPNICPMCKGNNISSNYGGVDELVEILSKDYNREVIKINNKNKIEYTMDTIYVSTRIFDPSIEYNRFEKIIFVRAENLIAGADYLVEEDMYKSLAELFLQIDENTEVIFDTNNPDLALFQEIIKLDSRHAQNNNPISWYNNFVALESIKRQKFIFPPFYNLALITTQEKNKDKSVQKINAVRQYIFGYKNELPNLTMSSPYPAKFLKRKGMFSHHLLLKFPKQYPQYFQLKELIKASASTYNVQVRLNPRHLF